MKKVQVRVNGTIVDVDASFEYRLNRFVRSSEDFSQRGGDTSTDIRFPLSKVNLRAFKVNNHRASLDKFNRARNYVSELLIDGNRVFAGELRIDRVDNQYLYGSLFGGNISWIDKASGKSLNELGFDDDGNPTWFTDFLGGDSINYYNEESSDTVDICFPTVVYNNTPITDYLDYTDTEIFGTYDANGLPLVEPLDFPNVFPLKRGFFGLRQGLTFEDFPPAIYYKNLLKKVFEEVGLTLTGELIQEDFFAKMIMPYTGVDPFNYNWKTLAYVKAILNSRTLNAAYQNYLHSNTFDINEPRFTGDYLFFEAESLLSNPAVDSTFLRFFTCANLATRFDDTSQRIDRVGSFRPYLVADKDGQYVCPVDGSYTIKVTSDSTKTITVENTGPEFYGQEMYNKDSRWDEQVLCVVRYDTDGELTIIDDLYRKVGKYIVGYSTVVNPDEKNLDLPSDLIAYFSPKRYANDPQTGFGSPLTSNESDVIVNANGYSVEPLSTVGGVATLETSSAASIEITLDLEKNERVAVYWVTIAQYEEGVFNILAQNTTNSYYQSANIEMNAQPSEFEVLYNCGYEGLDIASMLPSVSLLDFIGGFMRFFNLSFEAVGNEFRVFSNKSFYTAPTNAFDITDKVIAETAVIEPVKAYNKVTVGYTNDSKDKLLLSEGDECLNTKEETINYANYSVENKGNIYAQDELTVSNGFSSTKFSQGQIELIDTSTMVLIREYARNPQNLQTLFEKGISYGGNKRSFLYQLPTIQSVDSFEQAKVEDLVYDYDYSPRIMYYLGTKNSIEGISSSYRFPINIPTFELQEESRFWVMPTVCAFADENANTLQPLRFDGINGIFSNYFDNEVDTMNRSYTLTVSAYINSIDFNKMKGGQLLVFDGVLYRLAEISDFDPTEQEPAQLTLIRVI